ncbi:hypothetical protein FCV82_01220 [Vibrio breoganii]|uniref:hypothetical protein n=1 Tax=Vibrio breoganii TaxID=553239 RepID=UPI001055EF77|nr:hypothetical protein [Vibrio breoganii]TKF90864.1 hypothetical protein FCV82_01220 [Vibrio breoganii]TKG20042.1 hypothetical protein FCV81_11180 [Vibrio breoganii]
MPALQYLRAHIPNPEPPKIPAQGWNDELLARISLQPDNPSYWRTLECQPSSILERTYPAPNHPRFQLKTGMTRYWGLDHFDPIARHTGERWNASPAVS